MTERREPATEAGRRMLMQFRRWYPGYPEVEPEAGLDAILAIEAEARRSTVIPNMSEFQSRVPRPVA